MEDSQLSVDQVLSETADSIEKIQTVLSRPNIGPDDKKLLQAMLEDARRRQRAAQRAKLDALMSLDTPDVVHVGDEKPKEPVASTSGVSKGVCQPVVIQDDEEEEEQLERGGRGHPPTKVQGRKRPCDIQESKRTKKPKNFPSLSDEERLDPSYDPLNLDVEERDDDEGQSAVAVTVQPKRGRGARGRGRGGKSSTPRGRGRGRGRGSSRATTSETPNKPPAPATPSSRPKIKRLSWCSSSSETEGPPVSHKYTKGEMEIIYNTAWEDRNSVLGIFADSVTTSARRGKKKAIYKKIQANAAAHTGFKRRKLYLWKKLSDHRSTTRKKCHTLELKYGGSGAPPMPEHEGLTEIEVTCMEFNGMECTDLIAGAMKTPIDGPEHVVDSGEEFENLERAEEEQRQLISEYKVKTKAKKPAASAGDTDAAEDLEVDKMMSKFAPHVRVDPQPRTMKPQKPTAAETLRAQNLAPTLRRVRTTRSRSDVFHNSGNESDGEEEADDSPVKHISTTPTTDVNPRRASERIKMQGTPRHCSSVVQIHTLTEALTGQQADRQAKRQLDYVYAPEDLSPADPDQGLPDIDDTSPIQRREEELEGDSFDYSLNQPLQDLKVQSVWRPGVKVEAATKTAVSVAMSKPPTERLQVRMERGKRADSPHPFPKATATQSKKASAAAGAPPASSSGTDLQSGNDPGAVDTGIGTLQNVRPTGQLTHTTQGQSTDSFPAEALRERMVFQMDGNSVLGNADLIDQRIKQNVSQGMQDLSVDLQKQTKDIASVNAQVAAMRDDLNKKFNVTGSVNDIKNSINEFNSQVHNYSVDLCATKNDMSSVLTSIQQSESDIKMVKTSMLGIQRDTTLLKSDTHHLKSQHNAIRLDNEALKNDTISSTSEIQAVHAAVGLIKTDVQGQGAILSNVKANVDTLRHDMLAFKGQLDLADTKITGLKATLSRIEESVNLIKAAMMVAIPQSTPITVGEVEIKSDVEEPHESSVPALSSTPIEQENSEGIVGPSQNTSVVSFKPRPGEKTYEKHVKPDNLDDTEPECSAGAESSSVLAKDVGPVDKQTPAFFSTEMSSQQDAGQEDSQETQDPTHGRPDRYVADTGEYSESCCWADSMAATQGTENTERELPTDTASQPEDSGDTMVNIYTGRDAQGRVHIAGQLPQHVVERFTRSRGRDCAKKTK